MGDQEQQQRREEQQTHSSTSLIDYKSSFSLFSFVFFCLYAPHLTFSLFLFTSRPKCLEDVLGNESCIIDFKNILEDRAPVLFLFCFFFLS